MKTLKQELKEDEILLNSVWDFTKENNSETQRKEK